MPARYESPLSLLIIADEPLFGQALCRALLVEEGISEVRYSSHRPETTSLAARIQPDVILASIDAATHSRLRTLHTIRQVAPRSSTIVFGRSDGPTVARQELIAEAHVHLPRTVDYAELIFTIRNISIGKFHIHGSPHRADHRIDVSCPTLLSPRERQILCLVAQAMSNAQIARTLNITEATVKRHLSNVFTKLGASSRIDAVNRAIRALLIPESRHHPAIVATPPGDQGEPTAADAYPRCAAPPAAQYPAVPPTCHMGPPERCAYGISGLDCRD